MPRSALLALVVAAAGCGITSPSATNQPGVLAVWVSADSGWDTIDVSIDGAYAGTLTQFLNTQPGCASTSATVVVAALKPGSHTVAARSNAGFNWTGSASVLAGACRPLELTCP